MDLLKQRVSCVLHSLESERSWFGIKLDHTWFWMVLRTAIVQRRYNLCVDEKLTQLPWAESTAMVLKRFIERKHPSLRYHGDWTLAALRQRIAKWWQH